MELLGRKMPSIISENATTTAIVALLGTTFIVYRLSCRFVNRYLRSLTLLPELDLLNCPRPPNEKIKGTVVIAGASFAGLWTACVCSDHFEDVVVIEPDVWVCADEGTKTPVKVPDSRRAHVAQYNSLHGQSLFVILNLYVDCETDQKDLYTGYQTFALIALRNFFPSWDNQVEAEGGV